MTGNAPSRPSKRASKTKARIKLLITESLQLARDIERLIEDIDFQIDGGQILYAVDWSEIRSYVDLSHPAQEMKLFSEDDDEIARASQSAVIGFLLGLNPILLPPYAVELGSYKRWLEANSSESLTATLRNARDEIAQIAQSEEGQMIASVVDNIRDDPESVSSEHIDAVVRYVGDHATSLLDLLQRGSDSPGQRLDALLRQSTFKGLADCFPRPIVLVSDNTSPTSKDANAGVELDNTIAVVLDEDTAVRWESRLGQRRPRRFGPNYRDAYVMMLLEGVDKVLCKRRTRLCLVTRSHQMHSLMEQEILNGEWRGPQGNPLRHPRSFLSLYARQSENLNDTKERLQSLLDSIHAFVDTASVEKEVTDPNWLVSAGSDPIHRLDAETLLTEIKDDRRTMVSLMAAESWAHHPTSLPSEQPLGLDILVDLFDAIRDPKLLKPHIENRIRELTRTTDFTYQYLAAFIHGQSSPNAVSADILLGDAQVSSVLIDSPSYLAPYGFRFFSPSMLDWSERVRADRRIELQEILSLFADGFETGHTYEPLLAIAYFFGAIDRWHAASDFARIAMSAHTEGDPPPIDGLLFQAICLRRSGEKSPSYRHSALLMLNTAMSLAESPDPRLLTERATQLMYWNKALKYKRRKGERAAIEEAIDLFDLALSTIGERVDEEANNLRIRIYNNRCYYLIESGRSEYQDRAEHDLDRLIDAMRAITDDESKWLSFVLDTKLWAEWNLFGRQDKAHQRTMLASHIIKMYDRLLSRNIPAQSREAISEHRERILKETSTPRGY